MRPTHIILHHSATEDGRTFSWPAMRTYHMSWRHDGRIVSPAELPILQAAGVRVEAPWRDIGYHYGIELVDKAVEIVVGRMQDESGAHCIGMNDKSLGVCFVGNFDQAEPPREAWNAGLRLVRSLCKVFGIPRENVMGHRDFAEKTCPGRKFDLALFRSQLKGG